MSKFKALGYQGLKNHVVAEEIQVGEMRDFMFMCRGMWTAHELKQALAERIINDEDYNDLQQLNEC